MADRNSNDNDGARLEAPDAHGRAAILLVESLIHGLIAQSVISVADAVGIVEVAADVDQLIAAESGDTLAAPRKSLTLLTAIGASLSNDIEDCAEGRIEPPVE